MAGLSSGGTIGTVNPERLEIAKHKAKGALSTLRDLAILRTQFATLRDTGLLHPVRTLRETAPTPTTIPKPTVGVLGGSSSSTDVVEHVIGGETEEGHVVRLLQHAYDAFANAEFEEGKNLLKQASFISSCARCGRGILGIESLIEKGDLYEARRRLDALIGLIPAYYEIIEKESVFSDKVEAEKESGRESEKRGEEIEEVCDSCDAARIIEICNWDTECLDDVISFIETQKAKGLKVMSDELIRKAEEYRGKRKNG